MSLKRNVLYKTYFFIIKLASICKLSYHRITSDGKNYSYVRGMYRGADKSLARPERKKAAGTKL